jgi:hypothetical protein
VSKLKLLVRASVVGGVLTAGLLVAVQPAQASIGSCSGWSDDPGYSWTVYCNGSAPSSFRAKAKCYTINTHTYMSTKFGPWEFAGGSLNSSIGACPSGQELSDGTWETHI